MRRASRAGKEAIHVHPASRQTDDVRRLRAAPADHHHERSRSAKVLHLEGDAGLDQRKKLDNAFARAIAERPAKLVPARTGYRFWAGHAARTAAWLRSTSRVAVSSVSLSCAARSHR